ncbi:unnamed protein product [Periconia digitata]|uniref:AB hydrolase-1 domain-containing protein n=1 Tax=Periconia digitata TaxID=1303443 RepID=A0A9W4XHB6_9PLEO|nr:unnamed protein product [Periconia digitata]
MCRFYVHHESWHTEDRIYPTIKGKNVPVTPLPTHNTICLSLPPQPTPIMKLSVFPTLLLQLPLISAQEPCDSLCQTAYKAAHASDTSNWVTQNLTTDDPFYSTPSNTTSLPPGTLLRYESLPRSIVNTQYAIPPGLTLSRLLYTTEDIDRKPIPATAFILLPYHSQSPDSANKTLKTVVWTHGTAGRLRECTPLNNRNLWYEWQGPYALAQQGYAVIVPDYAGQGSDIPQGFMYEAGYLHAADAAYSLVAARAVLGSLLSEEYVVVGHSEGGMTAWRTNERLAMPGQEELLKAGKFLGAVAEAPALRPLDLIPESVRRADGGAVGDAVSVLFLQSLAGLFPGQFKIEDWVTDVVLGRLALADTGCLGVARALFGNLTAKELFKSLDWLKLPVVVDWQKRYNGAGMHPLAAPMLVVQGKADILTYANNTEWDFNQTCETNPESAAELLLYPEADHDMAALISQPDFMEWIRNRFDGKPVEKGCRTRTLERITDNFKSVAAFYGSVAG